MVEAETLQSVEVETKEEVSMKNLGDKEKNKDRNRSVFV